MLQEPISPLRLSTRVPQSQEASTLEGRLSPAGQRSWEGNGLTFPTPHPGLPICNKTRLGSFSPFHSAGHSKDAQPGSGPVSGASSLSTDATRTERAEWPSQPPPTAPNRDAPGPDPRSGTSPPLGRRAGRRHTAEPRGCCEQASVHPVSSLQRFRWG